MLVHILKRTFPILIVTNPRAFVTWFATRPMHEPKGPRREPVRARVPTQRWGDARRGSTYRRRTFVSVEGSARISTLIPVALVLAAFVGAAPSASGSKAVVIDVEAEDCTQIPPDSVPPPALSTEPALPLEVRVLVEAPDKTSAMGYMKTAKESFARIGINLRLRYQTVVAPAEWSAATGFTDGPGQPEIFEFMKGMFGGERPPGVDVVYFMTRHWDGGFADCIGGIRFPDRAFAFGSVDYATEGIVPAPTADEGVIAAHEIGHLLGAHHHYANCVEALPSGALRGDTNPCTTMWPAAANASSTFSLMERSFIHSYAELYAKG